MWKYGAHRNLTPVVDDPNIALEGAAGELGMILEWFWGGEVTTSTAMRTTVFRAAEGTGAATSITPHKFAENSPANTISANNGDHVTTKPAPDAGAGLFGVSWNAHGGVIRWLAAPGEEVVMLGASTVIIENQAGTAQSHYGFIWGEY